MSWELVRCLVSLRDEFNALAPGRDTGADGSIGDSAHTSASDHTPDEDSNVLRDHDADHKNEVHALDIDSTGPWPGGRTFGSIVSTIIAGERAKWLDDDDVCRLQNVIFNRKIYSRSWDFEARDYPGSDPHTNHAHFSSRYDSGPESDTRPWGVLPLPSREEEEEVDIQEFFASVGRATRTGMTATNADRENRNNFAAALRFTAGLNPEEQVSENMLLGNDGILSRIETNTASEESA
jgi:hypothetical protein